MIAPRTKRCFENLFKKPKNPPFKFLKRLSYPRKSIITIAAIHEIKMIIIKTESNKVPIFKKSLKNKKTPAIISIIPKTIQRILETSPLKIY